MTRATSVCKCDGQKPRGPPIKTALVIAVFAAVVLIFFWDVILGNRVLVTCNPAQYDPWRHYSDRDEQGARTYNPDALLSYVPRIHELSRSMREGRLPLWNPYILCGTPFFADPQNRVLYPISFLLSPFDPLRAIGYDIAIHVFLALVGMYLFLRVVGASTLGAVIGALTYGFSSFFFTRMGHPTFVASASWIPFMFYGFEKGRRRERTGTMLLTIFFVMGYLAGFPQVLLFGVTGLMVYALWVSLEGSGGSRAQEIARTIRMLGVSGLLSVLVVSVQLIPFGEFLHNSFGLGYSFEEMSRSHLWPPISFVRSVVPNFFGNPADGTSWLMVIREGVPKVTTGYFVYCGVGSFLLVCGSLALIARARLLRALSAVLVVSIGLGTSSLFLKAGYAVIPFIENSKIDRISVLACFAVSALSGITFSVVSRSDQRPVNRRFARIVVIATLIVLGSFIGFVAARGLATEAFLQEAARLRPRMWDHVVSSKVVEWLKGQGDSWLAYEMREVGKAAMLLVLSSALLLIVALRRQKASRIGFVARLLFAGCLVLDVGLVARGYYLTQPTGSLPVTEGIDLLQQTTGGPGEWRTAPYRRKSTALPPNLGQVFCIPCLEGRSTIAPDAHATFLKRALKSDKIRTSAFGGVRELTDEAYDLACARYLLCSRDEPLISPDKYSLIYDGDMRIYENAGALEKGICLRKSEVSAERIAGRDVLRVYDLLGRSKVERCGTVCISVYQPEYVMVDVNADQPCFLIFQDNLYPGWKAYVDGEEMEILGTDIGFRAIEVQEGIHTIVMRFRPGSLRIGIFATCIGVLASLLCLWRARSRPSFSRTEHRV